MHRPVLLLFLPFLLAALPLDLPEPDEPGAAWSVRKRSRAIARLEEQDVSEDALVDLIDLIRIQAHAVGEAELLASERAASRCLRKGCDPPGPDHAESQSLHQRALAHCEAFLLEHPGHARTDQVRWAQAMSLHQLGRSREASQALVQLIRAAPESQLLPAAYVWIGEYYLEARNSYKALLAFKKASTWTESELRPLALARLARCYHQVGEWGRSVEIMKAAVEASRDEAFTEACLVELSQSFVDTRGLEEAILWFEEVGRPDLAEATVRRLAQILYDQGHHEDALVASQWLLERCTPSSACNDHYDRIVQIHLSRRRLHLALESVERMHSSARSAEDRARIEARSWEVARACHRASVGRGHHATEEDYATAARAWDLHLSWFPDGEHAQRSLRYREEMLRAWEGRGF